MKPRRRVLGIDPGLARLGWAVVESRGASVTLAGCGCIETSVRQSVSVRLRQLYARLDAIIRDYRPTAMAVEKLFFTKNISTGIVVGQARGVVLLAAAMAGLPVDEFTPTTVKQSVTGDGRADKRQVQRMIQILLRLRRLPRHDDTADAIAVALCAAATKVVH